MNKETVGKVSLDLLSKPLETNDPIEQMREQLSEYDKNIFLCIENNKNIFLNDFYVIVITKQERLMPNVFRNYFYARQSCPTPDYDQTVYRYNKDADNVEFLWVIPSRQTCFLLKENSINIPEDQKELLKFVLDFSDGSLFTLCKKLNKEIE